MWFLGFSGAAQGEESRYLSHQVILTILIAVQYFNKAERSLITHFHVTCMGDEGQGLKTLAIMSVLYVLVLCYVVFEQNNEDFEIFMYLGKYKPVYTRARAHSKLNSTLNLYECMVFSYWIILKNR
jgi:hypothetical protein